MQVEKGYNRKNLRFSIVSFQPILRARSITVVHRIRIAETAVQFRPGPNCLLVLAKIDKENKYSFSNLDSKTTQSKFKTEVVCGKVKF